MSIRFVVVVGALFIVIIGIIFMYNYSIKAQMQENLIPREVLFGNPDKAKPRISPDGTKLAYLAPFEGVLNIWIRTIGDQDDQVITHDKHRGIRSYFWCYDNACIVYEQDKNGDENWNLFKVDLASKQIVNLTPFTEVQASVVAYEKDFPERMLVQINKEDKRLHDVYTLNLTTNELSMNTKNPGNVEEWCADSALQVRAALQANDDGSKRLVTRTTEQAPWQELLTWEFDDASTSGPLYFTKDGAALYVRDSTGVNASRLVRIDLSDNNKTVIAEDPMYDVSNVFTHPDTKELISVSFTKAREERTILDPAYQQDFDALARVDAGDLIVAGWDSAFNVWIIAFNKDNGPLAFYSYDRTTQQAQFLFHNNAALARYKLAHMEPVSFTSRDGLTVHGYLTRPTYQANAESLGSLVLDVHGGPWARDTWGYCPEAQWFANRGIACLQLNYRGSTGYGKEFLNAGNQEWARTMHNDLIDGINWALSQGLADPKKVAIYGGSYGGYAALVGATFTPDVFCCAIDIVGPSNLVTLINSFPPYWALYIAMIKRRIGDPITQESMLKERSPLYKVDAIKIPILIAQGANDPRVKQDESEQIVAAMKAKNIPYEYMLFADEGHGFARPENRLKFYAAAEKFLAKNIECRYQD